MQAMPMSPKYGALETYGPFYRIVSTTQTATAMGAILRSGELWGETPNAGFQPVVQALFGELPEDRQGFEFYAYEPPNNAYGPIATWFATPDNRVVLEGAYAKIPILIRQVRQEIA